MNKILIVDATASDSRVMPGLTAESIEAGKTEAAISPRLTSPSIFPTLQKVMI